MKNPAHDAEELARRFRLIEATHWRVSSQVAPRQLVRPDWVIERFTEGMLQVALDGEPEWQTFEPGDAIVYAPGCRFAERGVEGRPSASVYIRFTAPDARLRSILRMRGASASHLRIQDPSALLAAVIARAAEHFNGGLAASLQAMAHALETLALVMSAPAHAGVRVIRPATSEGGDLVTAVNRHLRENLASKLRLKDVAERMGMSESGLSHAYRRLSGRSPMVAMRAFRIEAAKVLLARGGMKLAAISPRTGFADAFHLSRTFRQVAGVSPREYLMQHRA